MYDDPKPTFEMAPVPTDVIFVTAMGGFVIRTRPTGIRALHPTIEKWCRENLRAPWSFETVFWAKDYRGISLYKPAIRFEDEVDLVYFKMQWGERL